MTKPKIPADIESFLRDIDLTIWACQYGVKYEDEQGNRTVRPRADKTRVLVQLAGPGLEEFSPWGEGATLGDAVRAAMANPRFRALRPGITGAMGRLETVMILLSCSIAAKKGGFDDDIPF